MQRTCPRCSHQLSRKLFFFKFTRQFICSSCGSKIRFGGIFSWGTQVLILLVVFGIYRGVDENIFQAFVVLPIAILFILLEYQFARIEIINP
jgi:hypothetical protein